MNGNDPLAQLHPLRAPEAIYWWPPAPGWWLLASLLLLALVLAIWFTMRSYQQRTYLRKASAELASARLQWQTDGDTLSYLQQVNRTLKAVAGRSFPAIDSAALSGSSWREFLNTAVPTPLFGTMLDWAPYAPVPPDDDVADQLGRCAEQWVRQHRRTL